MTGSPALASGPPETNGRHERRSVIASRPAAVVLAVTAAALAAGLLILVHQHVEWLARVDGQVLRELNAYLAPRPAEVTWWKIVSRVGAPASWDVLAGLATLWLLLRHEWRRAGFVVVTIAGAAVITSLAKSSVARPRPVAPIVLAHAGGHSFPSGHAVASFAAVGVALVVSWAYLARLRPIAIGIGITVVALIGFSRLVLGVHYLSDVLAGWLFALSWLGLTVAIFRPASPTEHSGRGQCAHPARTTRVGAGRR